MKLDELFNEEYQASAFKSKIRKIQESNDDTYLVKVRANVLKSVKQLERELPSLKHSIDSGSLELKALYISLATLLQSLKPMLDHMDAMDVGKNTAPSHVKDHPFWGSLPSFNS